MNTSINTERAPQSERKACSSSIPFHRASYIHQSRQNHGKEFSKNQNRTSHYCNPFTPDHFSHQTRCCTEKRMIADLKEAQIQHILTDLPQVALRELVTDYVLELLRFNLQQTDVHDFCDHKPMLITKPKILVNHCNQPLTVGNVRYTTLNKQPSTILRASTTDYPSIDDTLNVPKSHFESYRTSGKKNVNKSQYHCNKTSRFNPKVDINTVSFDADTIKSKDQNKNVPHSKYILKSGRHQRNVELVARPVVSSVVQSTEARQPVPYPSLLSQYQKRSPKLYDAVEQRSIKKTVPPAPKPSTKPLQSSMRDLKIYSTSGTLKKLRFVRQGSMYSEASKLCCSQTFPGPPLEECAFPQ